MCATNEEYSSCGTSSIAVNCDNFLYLEFVVENVFLALFVEMVMFAILKQDQTLVFCSSFVVFFHFLHFC